MAYLIIFLSFIGYVYRSHLPVLRICQRKLKPHCPGPDASCCRHRTFTYCHSYRLRYATYLYILSNLQANFYAYDMLVDLSS